MREEISSNSTRCVVSGREPGGILPGLRSEMWRDVYLRPGADVEGGIFCNRLHVEGSPIRVGGAVYAREAIEITCRPGEGSGDGLVEFKSAVSTPDSIVVDEKCKTRVRFFADVMAGRVNLRNCWVRGNIAARNATIEESVVLGSILCDSHLSARNAILGSFRVRSADLKPEVALLYPFASATERPAMSSRVRSLSVASLQDLFGGSEAVSGIVDLQDDDLAQVAASSDDGPMRIWLLTLAPRILDLERAKDRLTENHSLLRALSLGDHLDPHSRKEFEEGPLRMAEESLFRALRGLPDASEGEWTTMEEVHARPSVRAFVDVAMGQTS